MYFFVYVWAYVLFFHASNGSGWDLGKRDITETGAWGSKDQEKRKKEKIANATLLISGCSSSLRFTFFSYFLVCTVSERKTGSCPLLEQKTEDTLTSALKSAAEEKIRSRG